MPPEAVVGSVQLVGAGPGCADLLTLRAVRAIEAAEALLYDALVGEEVLALAPAVCTRIQTGKRAGRASMTQATINRLMLRLARRGLRVVRLKGGDPSIFGRSGEEVEFLQAHGVLVNVVPGVTAACAAASQFRFPLTHRGEARRVVFATARARDGAVVHPSAEDSADPQATLVFYMARDSAGAVFDRLVAAGRSARTPALAVEHAGDPRALLFRSDLQTLPALLREAAPSGPVLIVVGEVASRAMIEDMGEDLTRRLRYGIS